MARSLFHEQPAREVREHLMPGLSHPEAIAELEAPALHPHAEHEVEDHVRLHHRRVDVPQARRVVGPVGRVVHADRVADARRLGETVLADGLGPRGRDVPAERAWLHSRQRRVVPLLRGLGHAQHVGGRLAQVDGARHRAVVAQPAAAELEARGGVGAERDVRPCGVRRRGVLGAEDRRRVGGRVASVLFGAADISAAASHWRVPTLTASMATCITLSMIRAACLKTSISRGDLTVRTQLTMRSMSTNFAWGSDSVSTCKFLAVKKYALPSYPMRERSKPRSASTEARCWNGCLAGFST